MIDVPETYVRSLIATHTFSCALTTRGGICDCLPAPAEGLDPMLTMVKLNGQTAASKPPAASA